MKKFGECASHFSILLDELKAGIGPDQGTPTRARALLDAALESKAISLREWRELVEKCSKIRRTARH